ncbi:23S rRNA pseudouridine1911/1915/1917 synthase [Sporosarcina luteola]|nr:23S rRNA pseudouridine1911/1915/1917 synthase [Sporosarcina luteola]
MHIHILYEDNHLLVVVKPVNVPVQEDASGDADLLTLLKDDLKRRYQKPGNVFLGLVHRLDRPVGGVMVFAKTSKAASRLADVLRKGNMRREYLAVVRGKPSKRQATLEHFLWKDSRKNKVHVVGSKSEGAKRAILDYKVIDQTADHSLVAVTLQTGRSHQIRVQLAENGTPLYGDQKYGKGLNRPGEQLALWAHRLEFPHPTTKEQLCFESLPPAVLPWQALKKEANIRM